MAQTTALENLIALILAKYARFGVSQIEAELDDETEFSVLRFKIQQTGQIGEWGTGGKKSQNWQLKQKLIVNALRLRGYAVQKMPLGFKITSGVVA